MKYPELFLRFPDFKIRAITLSFDDGHVEDRKMIEILNRYNIKCTFNLTSGRISGNPAMVQFDEFNELYKGHEIACHTYTHPHLDNLDLGGIAYEVIKDREVLEEKTGRIVDGFAYPFGLTETEGMIDCIKSCGIKYGRTTNDTFGFSLPKDYLRWKPTCHQAYSGIYDLIERFFAPEDTEHPWRITPRLFYIWGHSYEYKNNWESLEKLCNAIAGKSNVWYATNMEIIDYISAFNMIRRSADGRIIYNPTDKDLYVWVNKKNIILEKGKTTVLE